MPESSIDPRVGDFLNVVAGIIREVDLVILSYKKGLAATASAILAGNGGIIDWLNVIAIIGMQIVYTYTLASFHTLAKEAGNFISNAAIFIANFMKTAGVQLFLNSHKLLLIVWEDYRMLFVALNNAASGLSETIGMNAGFIATVMLAGKSLYVAGAAFAGKQPKEADMDYLDEMALFMNGIQNKWMKYARNPGTIIDALNEWVTNTATRQYINGIKGIKSVAGSALKIVTEKAEQIDKIGESLDALINTLPDEGYEVLTEWWEQHLAGYDFIQEEYIDPILEGIDEAIRVYGLQVDDNRMSISEIAYWLSRLPSRIVGSITGIGPENKLRNELFTKLVESSSFLTDEQAEEAQKNVDKTPPDESINAFPEPEPFNPYENYDPPDPTPKPQPGFPPAFYTIADIDHLTPVESPFFKDIGK